MCTGVVGVVGVVFVDFRQTCSEHIFEMPNPVERCACFFYVCNRRAPRWPSRQCLQAHCSSHNIVVLVIVCISNTFYCGAHMLSCFVYTNPSNAPFHICMEHISGCDIYKYSIKISVFLVVAEHVNAPSSDGLELDGFCVECICTCDIWICIFATHITYFTCIYIQIHTLADIWQQSDITAGFIFIPRARARLNTNTHTTQPTCKFIVCSLYWGHPFSSQSTSHPVRKKTKQNQSTKPRADTIQTCTSQHTIQFSDFIDGEWILLVSFFFIFNLPACGATSNASAEHFLCLCIWCSMPCTACSIRCACPTHLNPLLAPLQLQRQPHHCT